MLDQERHQAISSRLRRVGWNVAIVAAVLAVSGIVSRSRSETQLGAWTQSQAIAEVAVVTPQIGVTGQELILPGQIEANYEAPIHARVSGYLKMWYSDIGAHVKAGQLLAEIDTPDLDQQLLQAKASLASAKADAELAELTSKRWKAAIVANAVSQQTIDEKAGDAVARGALADAAAANVQRLAVLESFKRVVAPFDGIVTARKTDIGALINANADSGLELFRVADLRKIRVYVRIPQAFSSVLTPGMKTVLRLPQFPGQTFEATLDTTANAVDHDSRTVLAEFLADNPSGKLWPGTYAEAHLQIPADPRVLRIPSSALIFRRDGLRIAVLGSDNKVALKEITLGRDLGNQVEVLSGVTHADHIVDSPPDSLADGDSVRVESARS